MVNFFAKIHSVDIKKYS